MSRISKPARNSGVDKKTVAHARGAAKSRAEVDGPLYLQLVESLREDILRGVFPVGSQLPSEAALVSRFEVSRHTVREALRQLRSNGLVVSRQGFGTIVVAPSRNTPFIAHTVSSIGELLAFSAETEYIVEQSDMVDDEDTENDESDRSPGLRWLRLQGFRVYDDPDAPPMCWTEVFIRGEYAGVERLWRRQRGSIWHLIEDVYGERILKVEQTLQVRSVPDAIADRLQVDPASSGVEVRRTYKTASDKIAEIGVNLYPAETFRFSMELRRT